MPRLSEVDALIVKSRCNGLSFCEMNEKESRYATDQIMFKCAAMFGCPLPQTEGFAEVISDALLSFLNNFGYGELTLDEVILAMQFNTSIRIKFPSGVEIEKVHFYGSCFNVDFISNILSVYMTLRTRLDRLFQNHIDGY